MEAAENRTESSTKDTKGHEEGLREAPWRLFSTEEQEAFREAYGPIDEATWDRARFRALHFGAALVYYGTDVGEEAIRAVGEYALRAAAL